MKTRAAVAHAVKAPLQLEYVDLRDPGTGEVLVEIKATGLCHSDYHQLMGDASLYPFPVILGHEGAGVVAAIGTGVTSVAVGDHVIPVSMPECGHCPRCLSGKTNLCDEFFRDFNASTPYSFKGKPVAAYGNTATFANFTVVKEASVAKIRKDVPLDVACYVGCGVCTGIGAVLHTAKVRTGSKVVVLGLGGIGLNVVQAARLAGAAHIIAVDINPARESVAKRFGATDFINPKSLKDDLLQVLRATTGGGADYSFECVGNTGLMRTAIECVDPGWGVATLIGVAPDGQELRVLPWDILMGRTVKGSFLGSMLTRTQLPKLLDDYAEGKINLDDLITHRLPLERINEGFELMRTGQSIRTVVTF
ncbi:MAG: zinc-binding dehydrogenase [Steroidobacteraceae bacterium]